MTRPTTRLSTLASAALFAGAATLGGLTLPGAAIAAEPPAAVIPKPPSLEFQWALVLGDGKSVAVGVRYTCDAETMETVNIDLEYGITSGTGSEQATCTGAGKNDVVYVNVVRQEDFFDGGPAKMTASITGGNTIQQTIKIQGGN